MRSLSPLRIIAIAGLASLALAGCGNQNPLKITRTDCPAVSVVKHANMVTHFRGMVGRDANDVLWTAQIEGLVNQCSETPKLIANSINVRVSAQRSAAGPAASITVPVFASVVREGKTLIAKDIRMVALSFPDNGVRAAANQSFTTRITDTEKAKTGKYEVLVGFQLTDDEALYNLGK